MIICQMHTCIVSSRGAYETYMHNTDKTELVHGYLAKFPWYYYHAVSYDLKWTVIMKQIPSANSMTNYTKLSGKAN